jgi:hypothetical protein
VLEAEFAASGRAAQAEVHKAGRLLQGLQRRLESQRELLRRDWSAAIHRAPELSADPSAEPSASSPSSTPPVPDPVLLQLSRRQQALDELSRRVLDTNAVFQDFQSALAASSQELAVSELQSLEQQAQGRRAELLRLLASTGPSDLSELAALRELVEHLSPFVEGPKSLAQVRLRQQQAEARQRQKLDGLLGRLDSFLLQEGEKPLGSWQKATGLALLLFALGLGLGAVIYGRRILAGLRSLLDEQSQFQETLSDWESRHAEAMAAFERRTEQCRQWVGRVAGRADQVIGIAQLLGAAGAAMRQRLEGMRGALESQSQARLALRDAATRLAASQLEIRQGASGLAQIASQSRILSFNASVEASRSGLGAGSGSGEESGAAFLVVADAMRQLAEQSSQTAAQLESHCEASQRELIAVQTALGAWEAPSALLLRSTHAISDSLEQQSQQTQALSEVAEALQPASRRGQKHKQARRSQVSRSQAIRSQVITLVPMASPAVEAKNPEFAGEEIGEEIGEQSRVA